VGVVGVVPGEVGHWQPVVVLEVSLWVCRLHSLRIEQMPLQRIGSVLESFSFFLSFHFLDSFLYNLVLDIAYQKRELFDAILARFD